MSSSIMLSILENFLLLGSSLSNAFSLIVVALLWGTTNPLLKIYSKGIETSKKDNALSQFLSDFTSLFFNWKYLVSFITNQMGSVMYYITLASADLTLAVPVTNSLTFMFTALSSYVLGERNISLETIVGMGLVVIGASLCVLSETEPDAKT